MTYDAADGADDDNLTNEYDTDDTDDTVGVPSVASSRPTTYVFAYHHTTLHVTLYLAFIHIYLYW